MEEKLITVTLEFETYTQTLTGEWADEWLRWVNGHVTLQELRSGNTGPDRSTPEFHNHWKKTTK